MAAFVYILCAVTSTCCAVLLFRNVRGAKTGLLFWSGLAFIFLAIGNVLLVVDLVLVPQYDLLLVRHVITFIGVALLLFGLIWETE
jgi:hypothetical protein